MDSMSLSLDDIIKKNKLKRSNKGGVNVKKTGAFKKAPNKKIGKVIQKKNIPQKKKIDARMKLIKNNRQKIIDAREVIAEHTRSNIRDARQLLSKKKKLDLPKSRPAKIQRNRSGINALTVQNDLMDEDEDDLDFDDLKAFKAQPITSIRRTVKNDVFRSSSPLRNMPRLPVFSINNINNREPTPPLDPFDCYVVPTRRPLPPLPPAPSRIERSFHANKMSAHMDAYIKPSLTSSSSQKSILRPSTVRSGGEHDDRFESDRYLGSETRGSGSRYTNESAGIFAKIVDYKSPPKTKGYRIIISNLVPSVSESDVEELFSEIGELVSAKLIKAGTAEVIFRNAGDDERAHDVYHNRLIDGQPMKITLTGGVTRSAQYSYRN
ncbi:hypothetical protein PVAND_014027 [Polypedilum vanderplanki]|uniref:RRM domain-containing protein n=1 Tax=Polypedilum vanderplanki TaxID=319348 RepID=A0A9J6CT00_POLVA|nr:hypothetical protein PVAND_014027 [Polypedilum vanderplanki]